ncbi:MAG TPA: methyltransferase [Mucilaginibacter sp.]|jgi:tRNA1Val (adenine37-N6)-methyltransferase|nr:methyltransferase [Mucilaginibacter sp.]
MSGIFKFKQFDVDQTGCALKINTDGVLIGTLTDAGNPSSILDIGTGTGVIALMLAQKFTSAKIDAVEIDPLAAGTAEKNFANSPFSERLGIYPLSFEDFFMRNRDKKYDMIVSNPPFYINSLKSPQANKELAKHTDKDFFERLIRSAAEHLTPQGTFWLILPIDIEQLISTLSSGNTLFPQRIIRIQSFPHSDAHRIIMSFGFNEVSTEITKLSIYQAENCYSDEYKKLLQPYFIAF